MTRHCPPPGSHLSHRGFSLIELLVSMTIGLVIVVAAGSAYLGASSAGKMAEAQSRMNEDGQAALNILTQQLRMAGSNPKQANRVSASSANPVYGTTTFSMSPVTFTTSFFSIVGCDGRFSNITATTATNLDALVCPAGTSTLPDSIAVNYEADRYNTVPTTAGLPTDCLGNALTTITATFPVTTPTSATSGTYTVADNRFYIGTSTAIVSPALYCKGNGGSTSAQPLVENIEDMQFTYGTVSATNTSTMATVAGYLPADQVVNETSLALLPTNADRWGKVLSVRICVLVRSETFSAPDAASAKYDDCQGNRDVAAPDLRLRRAYSTTVVLRNRRL